MVRRWRSRERSWWSEPLVWQGALCAAVLVAVVAAALWVGLSSGGGDDSRARDRDGAVEHDETPDLEHPQAAPAGMLRSAETFATAWWRRDRGVDVDRSERAMRQTGEPAVVRALLEGPAPRPWGEPADVADVTAVRLNVDGWRIQVNGRFRDEHMAIELRMQAQAPYRVREIVSGL